MRKISRLAGLDEFYNIQMFAKSALTEEERKFIEKIDKIIKDFVEERRDKFIDFDDLTELREIWAKYEHSKPFKFRFDPKKRMPKVFNNRTAFIIWTAWRSKHLRCQEDLLEEGSIAAAKILLESKPPLSKEIKERTINEFLRYLHRSYPDVGEMNYWEKEIFPLLEGKREFKWEIVQKCFYCPRDAIAICDSCSPTSPTGLTHPKPLCPDCIVNGVGINIITWLIPQHKGEEEVEYALRKLKSKNIKA